MIYFYSGHTNFGGSTLIIDSIVRLLNEGGVPALFYGKHPWFESLSRFNKAEGFPPVQPDDMLVCHYYVPEKRPNVRKSIYATHEETSPIPFRIGRYLCSRCGGEMVTRLTKKDMAVCLHCHKRQAKFVGLGVFDHVVFSSIAHEKKCRAAQRDWGPSTVIPNPIEVDFEWRPPKEPVAGIIGTINSRKAPHVSIEKAREAGFKKIFLYGNYENPYFETVAKPLFDDDVVYKGLVSDREEMYNSISAVFQYSLQEQASMVLGECKKLGIPFHCSDAVHDWDLATHEEIFDAWCEVLK